jgi:flagellar hook-basal body complex protein FliE
MLPVSPAISAFGAMPSTGGPAALPDSGGFAAALGDAAKGALATMRNAETVAMDGLAGRATVQDVVESVMAAERTLNASLAIRDKIVAAWLDVSRMQI